MKTVEGIFVLNFEVASSSSFSETKIVTADHAEANFNDSFHVSLTNDEQHGTLPQKDHSFIH